MIIETQADVERIMLDRDVAFHFEPVVTEQPGGKNWIARYPGADWSVSGSDAEQARARLRTEVLQRAGTPEAHQWKINAVRQHIAHGPIPGVYEFPNADVERALKAGTADAMDAAIAALKGR